MKVYILENGEYEQRGVVGVYSSQERAEEAGRLWYTDQPSVMEFDLDAEFQVSVPEKAEHV